jgi:acyl dehydratase
MPRYFEDVELGEELETPGRTITEADLRGYAAISGDHGALDVSPSEPGSPPAVPDLLVMAVSSGLGFRLPVEQPQVLAFMVLDLRARLPVRLGDTVRCRIRVAGKRPMRDGGVLVEQRQIVNQRGEVVQEAEYKLLVARRPRA